MSPRHRVLLADDTDVETWTMYLSALNCDTKVAAGDAEILDYVADWKPDLLLLDPVMPARNGFEICHQIKQNPITRKTMILMVTRFNELDGIERAVEAGTDDFLSKPANKAEFLIHDHSLQSPTSV